MSKHYHKNIIQWYKQTIFKISFKTLDILYKKSNVLNDILYMGVTCDALNTCLSEYNEESKLKRNQISLEFFRIFNNGVRNVKFQLIANFPCDNAQNLCNKPKQFIK